MKKGLFFFVVSAVLIFLLIDKGFEGYNEIFPYENKIETQSAVQLKLQEENIYKGPLILVNREHNIQNSGKADDIVRVSDYTRSDTGLQFDEANTKMSYEALEQFMNMIQAAEEDGVNHFMINSGYRSEKRQRELYDEMGADYALPAGYSEHNVGYSVDIGSSNGRMADADEGKWLVEHANEYGFILRYPEDKVDVTGIQFEPWHFRYVGLPHSVIIKEKQFVLEEYLEYLESNSPITASANGIDYVVVYYPYSKGLTIKVPQNSNYNISGNNYSGVILTSEVRDDS